jgi:hypothetical protein
MRHTVTCLQPNKFYLFIYFWKSCWILMFPCATYIPHEIMRKWTEIFYFFFISRLKYEMTWMNWVEYVAVLEDLRF